MKVFPIDFKWWTEAKKSHLKYEVATLKLNPHEKNRSTPSRVRAQAPIYGIAN
jgi:hypothetical protein